jgi:plasmid stability protein
MPDFRTVGTGVSIASIEIRKRGTMATLTIRGIDDDTKARLRLRAAAHGTSMEGEARSILAAAVNRPVRSGGFGTTLHERFRAAGIVDLEAPDRTSPARAANFDA